MQIHEVTLPTEFVGNAAKKAIGGIRSAAQGVQQSALGRGASRLAGGVRGAVQGVKTARVDRSTAEVADKAFKAWQTYKIQLLKADPTGKTLQPALLAFVNKNMLGGMYLPQVINKNEIMGLVNQIAKLNMPTAAAATDQKATDQKQPPEQKKPGSTTYNVPLQVPNPLQPLPGTPGAAKPQPAPVSEAADRAQELELFKKLAQQTAVAATQAAGTENIKQQQPDEQPAGEEDAHTYAETFRQELDQSVIRGMNSLAQRASASGVGTSVQSTRNPVADAVLILAGFRGL